MKKWKITTVFHQISLEAVNDDFLSFWLKIYDLGWTTPPPFFVKNVTIFNYDHNVEEVNVQFCEEPN